MLQKKGLRDSFSFPGNMHLVKWERQRDRADTVHRVRAGFRMINGQGVCYSGHPPSKVDQSPCNTNLTLARLHPPPLPPPPTSNLSRSSFLLHLLSAPPAPSTPSSSKSLETPLCQLWRADIGAHKSLPNKTGLIGDVQA